MDLSLVRERQTVAWLSRGFRMVLVGCAALAVPMDAAAQLVTPKTVPVLQSGQFDMFPSARAGMGGAVIAVDDTLHDPFVNPAKATRMGGGHIFGAPYFHSISGERGGGRSLPIGGGGSFGSWSAAALINMQQLDRAGPTWNLPTSERSVLNQYVAGSIARRITPTSSIGLGVQLAALDGIDGVDLLYGGSDRIDQSGGLADFRLGFTKQTTADAQFELLLLHSRTDMRHDVRFTTWTWDPATRITTPQRRTERNEDRTRIWGLHSEYSRPVGSEGWHIGWLGTVNRLSHPKIPNYVIQNIPRDPGTTYSFNAGVGVGRHVRGTTFAADLIYEPMFAETWADAASDTAVAGGGTIRAGERTVDNDFRFSNVKLRLGAGRDVPIRDGTTMLGFQAGLAVYAINYRLQQANHVQRTFRTQREDWMEWSPTLGLRARSANLDVMYNFSMTCGPGCGRDREVFVVADFASRGIIAAPSSQLFMRSGALKVHKLSILVPVR